MNCYNWSSNAVSMYLPHLVISTHNFNRLLHFLLYHHHLSILPYSSSSLLIVFQPLQLFLFHCFRHHNLKFVFSSLVHMLKLVICILQEAGLRLSRVGECLTSNKPWLLPFHFSVHSEPQSSSSAVERPTKPTHTHRNTISLQDLRQPFLLIPLGFGPSVPNRMIVQRLPVHWNVYLLDLIFTRNCCIPCLEVSLVVLPDRGTLMAVLGQ